MTFHVMIALKLNMKYRFTIHAIFRARNYDIIAAEGRGLLTGRVFRIGHMGYVSSEDIDDVFRALKDALPKLGFAPAGVS